ncbi:hypothetical protein SAY87_006447 [Trapa incisa]|uniref:X8 domain-containing protein n=1 Tax=Trapa incisa TaxID=236973 RepID=A0AAN7Q3W4_9MYRT|nr:hypothetical protein SAY87_006447 [Trapa incisa]
MAPIGVVLLIFLLSTATHRSCAGTWCTCREGLPDSVLQKTLDYACGAGGDCGPIHQKGPCFQPNTVRAHCSYAVNSYFQRKGQALGSCDFAGTAKCSSSDPSFSSCIFPSSASIAGATPAGRASPASSEVQPSTNTPANPYITSPGINAYYSHGGLRPPANNPYAIWSLLNLLISWSLLFWA